jgi:hypothetical protein
MSLHGISPNTRLKASLGRLVILTLASVALMALVPGTLAASVPMTRIKIDTVPDEYMPTNVTMREPVSMQEFHFEVNTETKRARVFVGYTYPDELINDREDDNGGPAPTVKQIPGLDYDAAAHQVVYEGNGKRTVCADVLEHKGLFGQHLKIRNTGACTVTAEDAKHAEDDGWAIQRFRAIDTYFEVR